MGFSCPPRCLLHVLFLSFAYWKAVFLSSLLAVLLCSFAYCDATSSCHLLLAVLLCSLGYCTDVFLCTFAYCNVVLLSFFAAVLLCCFANCSAVHNPPLFAVHTAVFLCYYCIILCSGPPVRTLIIIVFLRSRTFLCLYKKRQLSM